MLNGLDVEKLTESVLKDLRKGRITPAMADAQSRQVRNLLASKALRLKIRERDGQGVGDSLRAYAEERPKRARK